VLPTSGITHIRDQQYQKSISLHHRHNTTFPTISIIFSSKMDEAILQEAIQGLKSQEFTSQKAAIEHFDVKRSTLNARLHGRLPRAEAFQKYQKLSPKEEGYLLAWIKMEDLAGASPTFSRIRSIANRVYQHQTNPPDFTKNLGKN
jgi:hypothetical protein